MVRSVATIARGYPSRQKARYRRIEHQPDVILAAPPCTDFALSGNQWWPGKDADGRTAASVALVRHTLALINHAQPRIWALENPVGRLPSLIPELGRPWYWQPYWYGDAYSKKTGLWGRFNRDLPRSDVEPVWYTDNKGNRGSWYWKKLGGKSERVKEIKSTTPQGFSEAFYVANRDWHE